MYCPNCNAEIKDHDKKQCPQCNSLLLEMAEQEISKNGLKTDQKAEHTVNAGGKDEGSKSSEPDEFDALLAGIADDIDQILAADEEDTADSEAQVQKDDEAPEEEPEVAIELTDSIEPEDDAADEFIEKADDVEDYPIDDLEPLIQEFDELIEKDSAIETDTLNDYEPEDLVQDEVPAEESEAVIELTDSIESEDVVEDELIEKVTDVELEAIYDLEPEPMKDDGLIEEITEDDLISADVVEEITEDDYMPADVIEEITGDDFISDDALDFQVAVDDEVIEEITEDDFVSIKALTTEVAEQASTKAPAKPKRSSKTLIVLAGMVVLLIAGVLGGWFYLKTKQAPATISPKPSTSVVKKEATKVFVPKEAPVDRKPQSASKSIEKQQTDSVKTEPAPDKPKAAGSPKQVNAEQKPRAASNEIEPQTTDTAKPAASVKVVKSDTDPAYIASGEPYFTIQVATLKDKAKAESILAKLRKDGYAAYVSEKADSTGTVRYKLRIGKYKTRKEAKQAAGSYFSSKQTPFIIVQSKEAIVP